LSRMALSVVVRRIVVQRNDLRTSLLSGLGPRGTRVQHSELHATRFADLLLRAADVLPHRLPTGAYDYLSSDDLLRPLHRLPGYLLPAGNHLGESCAIGSLHDLSDGLDESPRFVQLRAVL